MDNDDDAPHPLKAFAYGFGGMVALMSGLGVATGPIIFCIIMSVYSGWWALAAFTIGFAWLIGTLLAILAWIDRMGWSKYLPSLSHAPTMPPPSPLRRKSKRAN